MQWKIIADSSCDMVEGMKCTQDTTFATVPLKIRIGDKEFIDDASLDVAAMMEEMAAFKGPSSSACPSPDEWAEQFRSVDCSIAITISGGLSGSYNCAMAAKDMVLEENPEKKIHVVDSLATSGTMMLLARKVNELIAKGLNFSQVVEAIESYRKETHILFCLASFDNLVKNGRMNRVVGTLASALNIRAIGRSNKGKIELIHKARGQARALAFMVEEMMRCKDLEGEPVVITHCGNLAAAEALQKLIEASVKGAEVVVMATRGLTSYYAEQAGLIVGY